MRLVVKKEELDWAKEMQDEGRTRDITFSTFRKKKDDSEVEVEIVEIGKIDDLWNLAKEEVILDLLNLRMVLDSKCKSYRKLTQRDWEKLKEKHLFENDKSITDIKERGFEAEMRKTENRKINETEKEILKYLG